MSLTFGGLVIAAATLAAANPRSKRHEPTTPAKTGPTTADDGHHHAPEHTANHHSHTGAVGTAADQAPADPPEP